MSSLDLLSFIPGIGSTTMFSPGTATPSPWNVNHRGGTDGTTPSTATNNMAELYNRILLQIAATIDYSGVGINNNNWAQLPDAVRQIAQNVVNAALGSGYVTTATYNTDFNGSLVSNGYYHMKGGLLLQWGSTATPTSSFPASFTTTFPLAFPTNVFQVYGTMQSSITLTPGQNNYETEARLTNKTLTTATWYHDFIGDNNQGAGGPQRPFVYWFALGN